MRSTEDCGFSIADSGLSFLLLAIRFLTIAGCLLPDAPLSTITDSVAVKNIV